MFDEKTASSLEDNACLSDGLFFFFGRSRAVVLLEARIEQCTRVVLLVRIAQWLVTTLITLQPGSGNEHTAAGETNSMQPSTRRYPFLTPVLSFLSMLPLLLLLCTHCLTLSATMHSNVVICTQEQRCLASSPLVNKNSRKVAWQTYRAWKKGMAYPCVTIAKRQIGSEIVISCIASFKKHDVVCNNIEPSRAYISHGE